MKTTNLFAVAMIAGGCSLAMAQTPNKVGIIHIQQAIISTQDGQKAASELETKFAPKRKSLEARQSEIAALQAELAKGSNTMAEAKRLSLTREIDQKTKELNRATEDAQAEFEQERNRVLNELGQRMMVVLQKYAQDNAFGLILDVSSPETPVLYAANGIDVTKDIIDLYDKNAAPPAAAAPAKPAPAPATPAAKPKPPAGVK